MVDGGQNFLKKPVEEVLKDNEGKVSGDWKKKRKKEKEKRLKKQETPNHKRNVLTLEEEGWLVSPAVPVAW